MDQDGVEARLSAGISAAKAGSPAEARELLLQVIEADRQNELAWLWLSSVMDSEENRRICLENVLVLNPDSEPARRGLARLDAQPDASEPSGPDPKQARRFNPPITPAAAILYPERQVNEWHEPDPLPLPRSPAITYGVRSNYDDIWEREDDICVYCAAVLSYDDTRCPSCKRNLLVSQYRYPRASTDLTLYAVFLMGVAQLYFLQVLLDVILGESILIAIWHGFLFAVILALIVGIFRRKFWAYATSMVLSMLILAAFLLSLATGPAAEESISQPGQADLIQTLTDSGVSKVANTVSNFLPSLQMVAVALALLYALLKVGPDFERVRTRQTAAVAKGLRDAPGFYARGKEYATEKKWAGAVLHWQRAAALDPNQVYYQRVLGDAYARLGFYERSLDVLKSAYEVSANEETRAALAALIEAVRQAQAGRPAIEQKNQIEPS